MFNPSRLTVARKRRGMTKIRLAKSVGLHQQSITYFESGDMIPSAPTLAALGDVLHFPAEFFHGPTLDEPPIEGASFRSLKSMTAGQRDAVFAAGAIAFALSDWIAGEGRFTLPNPNIPDLREFDPEDAAAYVRAEWKLGETPIKNMIHLLELKGVRVFSLAEDSTEVDAFSLWRKEIPFVFLNTLKTAEHGRMDAAHELGHLVLHRHDGPRGRDLEQEANRFASAFLMPRGSVLGSAPVTPTVRNLIQLKKNWNVSLAALVYRLRSLSLLTEWKYRSLCIDINKLGFRKTEPEGIERETSQVLRHVFTELWSERITREDVAKRLSIYQEDLDALVFEVMTDARRAEVTSSRHLLRLV